MVAFYNEIDPLAAATIREAIARDLIAPGVVDERDIRDIRPDELAGFTQVHLFAGGGIWSYALRRAGWPDDRPIWTCSCPCQPFSTAGKGEGFSDERHLWPAAYWLIAQCNPECVVGEQVAGKGADAWLDLVQADMEAMGHAFGCVPLASAGFGAPNPRHRSFWLAHSFSFGREGIGGRRKDGITQCGCVDGLADAYGTRRNSGFLGGSSAGHRSTIDATGATGGLAHAHAHGSRLAIGQRATDGCGAVWLEGSAAAESGIRNGVAERSASGGIFDQGPTNGFWRDADWLLCRDPRGPRWRPVDAGTFPLAPGHPARVGGLRISGNAINAEVATAFIEAVIGHLLQSFNHTSGGVSDADRGVGLFHIHNGEV